MAKGLPLHRITVGRTREVRGPDAMERLAAGVVASVVVGLALGFGAHQVRMFQALDAVSLATGPTYDAIIHRALHGAWPEPADDASVGDNVQGRWVRHVVPEPYGGLTMHLTFTQAPLDNIGNRKPVSHGIVSMRPQWIQAGDFAAVTLLCGYAKPVPGAPAPRAVNRTTAARQDLPPFCR